MVNKTDLHTHSTFSDGTLTPTELVVLAKKNGLCAIALTDHDTTAGHEEFLKECEKQGIEGVPGVEISTKFKRELHIVSLYAKGHEFEEFIEKLKNAREDRNIKMLERLREVGFDINVSDIVDEKNVTVQSAGRPHMANALVRKGYVKDITEAFEKFLGKGKKCYVKRFSLTPEESIRIIKQSGGIAILAHPCYAVQCEEELAGLATKLKNAGLDAMECLYSRYDDTQTEMCLRVAESVGLLKSGGSDFHGMNKPDVKLGVVNGGYVPYEFLETLKGLLNK